jgi:uncharacterized protein (TIGR04222 family)
LLSAPLVVGLIWRLATRLPKRVPIDAGRPLTVYELAYLSGGDNRVVETVIAALVERGLLRPSSDRKIRAVGAMPTDPLEAAVVGAASGRSAWDIVKRVRLSAALRALTADLQRRGLVVPGSRIRVMHRTVFWLYVAVFGVGLIRWINGLWLGRPIGWLSLLLLVAIVACVAAFKLSNKNVPARTTPEGLTILSRELRRRRAERQGAVLLGAAGAVAVGGLARYPDEELSDALGLPVMGSGSYGAGGSGYSCGSGGGGTSCGGGG